MKLALQRVGRQLQRKLFLIFYLIISKLKSLKMETRVRDVVSSLKMEVYDEVVMVGIKGIGGSGKTATARAVFDHLSNDDFEAKIFVENVREVSITLGLKKLQEIISEVLNVDVTLDSVENVKEFSRTLGFKKLQEVLSEVLNEDVTLDSVENVIEVSITIGLKKLQQVLSEVLNEDVTLDSVENVIEVSRTLGLKKLQEQVLSEVLNEDVTLDSVDDGKNMMKRRMSSKKVLLVLDYVDHIEQLEALAGERKWFKPGSRILITTRDEQVLVEHRVNVIRDINLLSDKEAISLFSRYAFGSVYPSQGYEELSLKVLRYTSGLPVSIKALGSLLRAKDKDQWVYAIERLEEGNRHRRLWADEYIEDTLDNDMAKTGLKKLQEQVLSNKRLRFSLGIMLMLIMVFICYFYSMASSSNSSAPKLMVSTSNSSVENSIKYDVFLSFSGKDTRNKFVSHLDQDLQAKGIVTFKDDVDIEKGERIDDQLLKSIEESRFYIIVFSKNYASSSWCLDELVKIIECQKMTEHTAFPVFYDVDPTHVENQDGPVGEAFSKHKNHEAAGKWRDAMVELAGLAGWDSANWDESKLIQKIVHHIFIKKYSTLSNADEKLVGMETRISDVLSSLEIGTEDVRMIGIKGIGGGGKTTLARAVYDRISTMFEEKTFVENVREVSQPSLSGLKELQKQMLEDVLHKKDITFSGVQDGKNMLKVTMRCRKMLVILDDVDRIEQLEALAGSSDWFKSGSRIIITTRDEQVLLAHGVSMNFVHDVNLLSHEEAICLFSSYAFRKEIPIQGYEELSEQVVQYADGLPLTIKVLGSFLCGKDKLEWQDAIDRLKKIPLKETQEKLELSYISLEDEHKEIFLDVACILKGQHKQKAIRILESNGFHAIIGLKVLEQRSLLTISKCGVLGMHVHIEEMGKNIVRRGQPDEPHKHSRLWNKEEIEDILANDKGTEETRCLKLDMSRGNSRILMKGLGKMKKLRYLEVNFAYYDTESDGECLGSDPKFDDTNQLDKSTQFFPNSLKYLKCERYPFLYLPRRFQTNNLVGLEMKCSRMVQLWEEGEKKDLQKLKFLSLSDSELTTFDFRSTPNLEELYLENSDELEELCVPGCQKLKHLDVSNSKSITFDLGLTPNLETLSLFVCTHFVKLKVPVECPNLKYLNLRKSSLISRSLDLQYSDELVETNAPVGCLQRLKGLYVTACCRLGKLPKDIGQVELLEKLDLCFF